MRCAFIDKSAWIDCLIYAFKLLVIVVKSAWIFKCLVSMARHLYEALL